MAFRRPPLSSAVTCAFIFFFLEVALARTPLSFHGKEFPTAAVASDDSVTVPINEVVQSSILRLHSDNADVNDESPASDNNNSDTTTESTEPLTVKSVPLTVMSFHDFRPINSHSFPAGRPRHPLRMCQQHHHHHHHQHSHPFFRPMEKKPAAEEDSGKTPPKGDTEKTDLNMESWMKLPYRHSHPFFRTMENPDAAGEIPHEEDPDRDTTLPKPDEEKTDLNLEQVRLVRLPFHHHHHFRHHHHHEDGGGDDQEDGFSKYLLKHSHGFGKEKFKKHFHHKHEEEEDDDDDLYQGKQHENENNGKKKEEEKKKGGGFVKRIRKFLNHF